MSTPDPRVHVDYTTPGFVQPTHLEPADHWCDVHEFTRVVGDRGERHPCPFCQDGAA